MSGFGSSRVSQVFSVRNATYSLSIGFFALALWSAPPAPAQTSDSAYRNTILSIQGQIQNNDLDAARASLATALKRYPNDGGLENLLGVIDIQSGHAELASKDFSLAIAHAPRLASAYLNLARIDMQTADRDAKAAQEALHLYRKVLLLQPGNPEAAYGEATLELWARQYAPSLASLAKLPADDRTQARVLAIECAAQLGLGHKQAAEHTAAKLASAHDLSETDAMLVLPALREAHSADLLDTIFTAVNASQPLSAQGLRILGLAQEAEGNTAEARQTLERVYALDPSATAALVDLARIALTLKDNQGALGYLAHARALQPGDASLAYEYGFVCLQMNLLHEARVAIGGAVKLKPDDPDYNLTMGTVSSGADALPFLAKYQELRPNDPAGELAYGIAYFGNNDLSHATIWLMKAASDPKTRASAGYYLGRILNQQGKYDEAIARLNESARLKPDQPEVYAELGEAHLRQKQYPQATADVQHALLLNPDSYAANYTLLRLYGQTHDARRAEQAQRFEALRNKNEEQYHDAMRIIEARPETQPLNHP